jgi:hypothetical protein
VHRRCQSARSGADQQDERIAARIRHAPLTARILIYIRSLTRKTGRCRLWPEAADRGSRRIGRDWGARRTTCAQCEFFTFDPSRLMFCGPSQPARTKVGPS